MNALELKIPPPIIGAAICAAMWGLSLITPVVQWPYSVRIGTAIAIALAGGIFAITGRIRFLLAKTTHNPMKPQATSSLVTTGVYKFTRNPMCLGLLFVTIAWVVFLSSPWTLLGPYAYVLYITRFQIIPEERTLSTLFGSEYTAYKSSVRRWL